MRRRKFEELVESVRSGGLDVTHRAVPYRDGEAALLYIAQLTDRSALSEDVVRPLVLHCAAGVARLTARRVMDSVLFADSCRIETDSSKVLEYVLSGMVVLLFSTDESYLVINEKKVEKRSVPTPDLNYTIRGGQDCFTENLDDNLSLVRYRVKDPNLRIEYFEVGVRTRTRVAVLYIGDVANDTAVSEVQKRIQNIRVDGICGSGELQALMLNDNLRLFPQMGWPSGRIWRAISFWREK